MAISRQSDSIWVESAQGYGHSHRESDRDIYGVGPAARKHGESLGRKHADESFHAEDHNRDARGRFVTMPHHDREKDHESNKFERREHRDHFEEGYHTGFNTRIKEHEKAAKDKANSKKSAVLAAITVDPFTRELNIDDPGRLHYILQHGNADGYVPPPWIQQMKEKSGEPDSPRWDVGGPTKSNPYRTETETLMHLADHPRLGLNLGLSTKKPFSRADVGETGGRKSELNKYAPLRPGELASKPIQVTDHMGNVHTFVHHISAPHLNPINPEHPEQGGQWAVSLHHHISRPDGTADWLPSEVEYHRSAANSVDGKGSDDVQRDLWGDLEANSDMVSMYGAGAQRVGDKHREIKYEFRHPAGDVHYQAQLVNGFYPGTANRPGGFYYDPLLPEGHREALKGGPQWNVTGHSLERQYPHDPKSPVRPVLVEGSKDPRYGKMITFKRDDLPGVIQHVWDGLGVDHPSWQGWLQHARENTGGKPPEMPIRESSIRPWSPEHNIHRSAERMPLLF